MTTTSKNARDYLKVPDHQDFVQSKLPRRTASFIDKPNRIDERTASNLSLPSAGHGILKQANTPHSSHLNVHYEPNTIDKIKIIPTIESPDLIEPRSRNNQHTFKIPTHYGLQKSSWINSFSQKRYEISLIKQIRIPPNSKYV
jgi:hypothetical protein